MTSIPHAIDHVLAGRTIEGNPAKHKPIAFPRSVVMADALIRLARPLHTHLRWRFLPPPDFERIASRLLASGAHYVIRCGPTHVATAAFNQDVLHASHFLPIARLGSLLTQPYAWFVRQGRVYDNSKEDRIESHREVVDRLQQAHRHRRQPLPAAHPIWQQGDITLYELRDPVLIFDEGLHWNNCLATDFIRSLGPKDAYPQALTLLSYAQQDNIRRRILSLRRADKRLAVFEPHPHYIYQFELQPDLSASDRAVYDAAVQLLAELYASGPVKPLEPLPVLDDPRK